MLKQIRFAAAALAAVVVTCGTGTAFAQGMPLAKAVQSGEDAKRTLSTNRISADVAAAIVDACVQAAKAVNGSVSVFVLSNDGQIANAHRMDGQDTVNTETALLKAQTALHRGQSTRQAANQFATLDAKIIRLGLGFYLVPGGLPIIVDDVMIGAIGVGGGRGIQDEACAYQALTKVLGPQPPLEPALPPNPLGTNPPPAPAGGRGGRGGN